MTLSTLRIIFVTQGKTRLAPAIAFFEILIWLVVISQVLKHISNPLCAVAYAGGYSVGNYLGLILEERLAMGMQILRIILPYSPGAAAEAAALPGESLAAELRGEGFGVTEVDGKGSKGPVRILFTLARRRNVERILEIVHRHQASAFYSIEDVRRAAPEVYPRPSAAVGWLRWDFLRKSR